MNEERLIERLREVRLSEPGISLEAVVRGAKGGRSQGGRPLLRLAAATVAVWLAVAAAQGLTARSLAALSPAGGGMVKEEWATPRGLGLPLSPLLSLRPEVWDELLGTEGATASPDRRDAPSARPEQRGRGNEGPLPGRCERKSACV